MKPLYATLICIVINIIIARKTSYLKDKKCRIVNCSCVASTISDKDVEDCPNEIAARCFKQNGGCQMGDSGKCEWDISVSLANCLKNAKYCRVGGCNGNLCLLDNGSYPVGTCENKPHFRCFKHSTCNFTLKGTCEWKKTPLFIQCLKRVSLLGTSTEK